MKANTFKLIVLIFLNLAILVSIYFLKPDCEPCPKSINCLPCISSYQIILAIILIVINTVFFLRKK